MENVIVAIITGGLALVGVIISNLQSNKVIENKLVTAQAVTDTKIENLTEEVRKHNNFALKIPVLENRIANMEKDIQELKRVQ
jgi:ribonuclease HIII